MIFSKHSIICLSVFTALLLSTFSYSQIGDSLLTDKNSFGASIDKVIQEVKDFYQNNHSSEFISPSEYLLFYSAKNEAPLPLENHPIPDYSTDYWQSDKVNPYRDVILSPPFKIEFDQSTFTHPIYGDIVVTSRFGRRRRGPHRGIDIDLVTGDAVRTVLPGKVRFVGYSRGHGKTIVVRHANEIETVYAHLSAYGVSVNDIVTEGQIIGLGGNTGNSRGSHLHLEVRYKGVCIHPEYVFNFDGSQTIRGQELWVTNAWKSPRFHSSYKKSKVTTFNTESEAIVAQKKEPRYYSVRKGDTLSHIGQRYNLSVREICRLNSISRTSTLRIGQRIRVR